ncbi:MAG: hypothetical protein HY516_04115 [Candidatus Aenigmarchaeota archaeon]|nr:hypothetical protein [Candidatus Aenigmarchaeota archaeon]
MKVAGKEYRSVWFENGSVFMVDQKKLPSNFEIAASDNYSKTASLIRDGTVRGSLSVGAAAAFGIAQAAAESELKRDPRILELARDRMLASGPLSAVLEKCIGKVYIKACVSSDDAVAEAGKICDGIISQCRKLSECGREIVGDGSSIAAHCTAGWLASIDCGIALGVVFTAKRDGKNISVLLDGAGPGGSLASWELGNEGIVNKPVEPNSFAHYAQKGEVDVVISDAESVLLGGDVVSTTGALEKAIVAKELGVPFYVAAPTIIFGKVGGADAAGGFDVTPARYISGIITPDGIVAPDKSGISKLLRTF